MDECLKYAEEHKMNAIYQRAADAQLMHASKWLWQIAHIGLKDAESVKFLTTYIKKHFSRFLFARNISYRLKLFVMAACVNFNLARKILSFVYTSPQEKSRQQP